MASKLNLLAFDLGASNGRAIVGQYDGERLNLIEVHKFPNGPQTIHGHMYWNILDLFAQIKTGVIKACAAVDGRIDSMAIDTWGVDYGLWMPTTRCFPTRTITGTNAPTGFWMRFSPQSDPI